jgi:hypothetical protein
MVATGTRMRIARKAGRKIFFIKVRIFKAINSFFKSFYSFFSLIHRLNRTNK